MAASSARASTWWWRCRPGPTRTATAAARPCAAPSRRAYREKFALTPPGVPVEFINIRVAVRAPVSGSEVVLEGRAGGGARAALKGTRRAYFPDADGWVETSVYDRYRLGVGDEIAGPAVVEEEGSTLVIGPGATAVVARSGNLVATLPPHPALSPEGRGGTGALAPEGGEGEMKTRGRS